MENHSTPLIRYMREVLEDHTLPLEDLGAGLIEAVWLIHMINKVEKLYRENGTI